ncbi:MAG: hypothetical protein R3C14_16635 [Caldilineaceae bacterium]
MTTTPTKSPTLTASPTPTATINPSATIESSTHADSPHGNAIHSGDPVSYTVKITNTIGVNLSNTKLTVTMPNNGNYISGSGNPPPLNTSAEFQAAAAAQPFAGQVTWQVGTLQVGQSFTAHFTVQATAAYVVSRTPLPLQVTSDQYNGTVTPPVSVTGTTVWLPYILGTPQ